MGIKDDTRFTMRSITFDPRITLFKSVIIDESHKCKSSKTQQSKFLEGICKGKEYILELTGTPVVNNNTDLIQQLKIMGRLEDFGGYRHFVERYCDGPKQSEQCEGAELASVNDLLLPAREGESIDAAPRQVAPVHRGGHR